MLISIVFLVSSSEAQIDPQQIFRLQILKRLGAEGRFVMPGHDEQVSIFQRFYRLDADDDGVLTRSELVEDREGIPAEIRTRVFKAADLDDSNDLNHDEFSEQVIVVSEGRSILEKIDADADRRVTPGELAAHCRLDVAKIEREFSLFDENGDGTLTRAEFLACFCEWTRYEQPPVTARLVARKKTYRLSPEFQTDAFRQRIISETDIDQLPPVPKVNIVLTITNTGDEPVLVNPRGSIEKATVTIEGEGLVRPENLQGGGGSSSVSTPQPVVQPGGKFRVSVRSLNPQENFVDNVYWTKPGTYQISASYCVYQNLPPHLPELFPDQPKPTGKPRRFVVTAPPVTVQVVSDRQ